MTDKNIIDSMNEVRLLAYYFSAVNILRQAVHCSSYIVITSRFWVFKEQIYPLIIYYVHMSTYNISENGLGITTD